MGEKEWKWNIIYHENPAKNIDTSNVSPKVTYTKEIKKRNNLTQRHKSNVKTTVFNKME